MRLINREGQSSCIFPFASALITVPSKTGFSTDLRLLRPPTRFTSPTPISSPHHLQIRPSAWRYSVPALLLSGEAWNIEDYNVKNVISYDGAMA